MIVADVVKRQWRLEDKAHSKKERQCISNCIVVFFLVLFFLESALKKKEFLSASSTSQCRLGVCVFAWQTCHRSSRQKKEEGSKRKRWLERPGSKHDDTPCRNFCTSVVRQIAPFSTWMIGASSWRWLWLVEASCTRTLTKKAGAAQQGRQINHGGASYSQWHKKISIRFVAKLKVLELKKLTMMKGLDENMMHVILSVVCHLHQIRLTIWVEVRMLWSNRCSRKLKPRRKLKMSSMCDDWNFSLCSNTLMAKSTTFWACNLSGTEN